ncbi:mitochondrial import inner membrane translocase subunit TIM14-like [Brevipalpus obovatus]|uniref:mitochondrial import inner membrane translocase subunit TIM14-like n=1 Tax=Brevipalpus obovatus TaxID=246614 RepID=UPI003D9E88BB
MSRLVLIGMGIAALGFGGKAIAQAFKNSNLLKQSLMVNMPSKYYRGGFDAKMNRREAGLILGISPSANRNKLRDAHRRIMILNHPDKGGSPYIASKINEAKDFLEQGMPR